MGDQHKGDIVGRAGRSFIESREHGPQEVLYLAFYGSEEKLPLEVL